MEYQEALIEDREAFTEYQIPRSFDGLEKLCSPADFCVFGRHNSNSVVVEDVDGRIYIEPCRPHNNILSFLADN